MKKVYSQKKMQKILRANNYVYVRSKGDHDIYKGANGTVVINKNLKPIVAQRIIKENNLKEDI